MTGHGEGRSQNGTLAAIVELRTINNRYLKTSIRTSDGYGTLEPQIDQFVRQSIRRGTVQVDLRIERDYGPDDFRINSVVLEGYWNQLEQLHLALDIDQPVRMDLLLALPGVVDERSVRAVDVEAEWPVIEKALSGALSCLSQMRVDEGRAMAADLRRNVDEIAEQLDQVEQRSPLVAESYQVRLRERLNKLLAEFDIHVEPSEIVREVGMFAERCDISEEIVRLRSHLQQFNLFMDLEESSGRKLEFLTQEMFREANTIGSKANDADIARLVIEIKSRIERMREMIQNVE